MRYIYVLINPKTNNPFYVGCTYWVENRFLSHQRAKCERVLCKTEKDKYIVSENIEPIFQVIEEVECDEVGIWIHGHPEKASLRESYWIEFFISEGFDMKNKRWAKSAA